MTRVKLSGGLETGILHPEILGWLFSTPRACQCRDAIRGVVARRDGIESHEDVMNCSIDSITLSILDNGPGLLAALLHNDKLGDVMV